MYSYDETSHLGFTKEMKAGSWRIPRTRHIEREAESQGVSIESIQWLLSTSRYGGDEYSHKSQARHVVSGVKINGEYWEANLYGSSALHHKMLFDYIPEHLMTGAADGAPVHKSMLLFNSCVFTSPQDQSNPMFWRSLASDDKHSEDWNRFGSMGFSGEDCILALSRLGWTDRLNLWNPVPFEVEAIESAVGAGISLSDALAWRLARFLHGSILDTDDMSTMIDLGVTPYRFSQYAERGLLKGKTVARFVENGVDMSLFDSIQKAV